MVSGENTDIHNTMITLQKAEVSFELMMQVRNKIVAAYEQIRTMQM
jgi:flagellar hook-basal body complex protein FliE